MAAGATLARALKQRMCQEEKQITLSVADRFWCIGSQFAMKQGLFVIEQSGETVRLANDVAFQPKVW
ncbi:MAG: hypothetical protein HQL88_03725 [Magnetococcales bacterium]|nr:hypothetical protein [Magnetococcales bacterium]